MARRKYRSELELVPEGVFKEPTYAYVWCEKIDRSKSFGKNVYSGENCAYEIVGKPVKCKLGGREVKCLETAHIYDRSPPTHRNRRR